MENASISFIQMQTNAQRDKWFAQKSVRKLSFLFIYFHSHHSPGVFKIEFIIFPLSVPSDENSGEKPRLELWKSSDYVSKLRFRLAQ